MVRRGNRGDKVGYKGVELGENKGVKRGMNTWSFIIARAA